MGLNGQGKGHMKRYLSLSDDAEVVALCDPDRQVLEQRQAQAKEASGHKPRAYSDIRELLQDDSIDVVSIATPNHWHSLGAIWACQAGKDVYVEKPLSHNVWEGRQLAEAARRYNRIVQHGTQQRSVPTMMRDIALIHDGFIGEVFHARGYVYKTRASIGAHPDRAPPDHLNWDLWQGPAQIQPFSTRYVHYNWHWFWEYGNGEIGNQGVHEMDVAVWGMNKGLPVRVYSTGGRYAWDDDGRTPNTQATSFTYADGTILTFEVRNIGSFWEGGGPKCGNSFFGSEGYYVRGAGFFNYKNEAVPVPENAELPPSDGRIGNFLKAVRSRKPEDVRAPALDGHLSCVHCHIGNAAFRLGRSLEFDPAAERFVNDDEANRLIRREYRQGFEVPQIA
jgi:predicted dehydrogenase